jgi:thioredoxin 1
MEHVTSDTYTDLVENADQPVLIDYWAEWCGPCRMIAPQLEILQKRRNDIKIVKINVDEQPGLAGRARVLSIPTLVLMRSGVEAGRVVGAMGADALEERVDRILAGS